MTDAQPANRVVHEDARLQGLREDWIAAENARAEAYRAFAHAHRHSPEAKALREAATKEAQALDRYSRALQQPMKDHENGE